MKLTEFYTTRNIASLSESVVQEPDKKKFKLQILDHWSSKYGVLIMDLS